MRLTLTLTQLTWMTYLAVEQYLFSLLPASWVGVNIEQNPGICLNFLILQCFTTSLYRCPLLSTGFSSVGDLLHQHYLPWGYASVCHVGIYLKPSQCQQRNTERNPFIPTYNISSLGLLTLFWVLNINWWQADLYLFSQCFVVCSIKNIKYFKGTAYQMYSLVSITVYGISNCYTKLRFLKLSFKVSCM